MYDPIRGSSREASLSFVNKVEPIFVVEGKDISADSQFFVFAQNPVGNSQGVSIAASHISGMKQGKSNASAGKNVHYYDIILPGVLTSSEWMKISTSHKIIERIRQIEGRSALLS